MISAVPPLLAQQIVASIKDVCGYDINFISTSGVIFASTNSARIGTFHEIGRQAAASGTAVEVRESHDFAGIQAGINVPVFHGGKVLAVIGITGMPDEVRRYAYLAERVTLLLVREQELHARIRSQADKRHFLLTALLDPARESESEVLQCLEEFHMDVRKPGRFLLFRISRTAEPADRVALEASIPQFFSQIGLSIYTFHYPGDFYAVMEEQSFQRSARAIQEFAARFPGRLQAAIGKSCGLLQMETSFRSACTAARCLSGSARTYVLFDDLTLEVLLSSADDTVRAQFLQKTIASLSGQELHILRAYFSENMSLSAASRKLYIHKNTLQYKLNHIAEKTGWNPRRFQDAVLLFLALELQKS